MKRRSLMLGAAAGFGGLVLPLQGLASGRGPADTPIADITLPNLTTDAAAPVVYYSPVVNSEALLLLLKAIDPDFKGKVGIKLTFENYRDRAVKINPDLIKPLVSEVKGTLIDSNYFDSARNDAASHLETAKQNGFDKVGPIDILDAEGEIALPVHGGLHLKTFITGAHLANYDTLISIVRFKGHNLLRYGGTMKNLSICLGTPRGAAQIHSGGKVTEYYSSAGEKTTSEAMADAVKAALDYKPGRWIFFNIIDALDPQRRDSCKEAKNIGDIGILVSRDPVACDQAAVDMVYGFAPNEEVRRKWEKEHYTDTLSAAEKIGVGSTAYRLQVVK